MRLVTVVAAEPTTAPISAFHFNAVAQYGLLANLLDGLVAVEGGRRSPTGELFNEVPDRVSDVLVLAGAVMLSASLKSML